MPAVVAVALGFSGDPDLVLFTAIGGFATLLFVDFATGTTLQLQGVTEIIWSGDDVLRLDGAERLWRFRVERGWRRKNALPLRWSEPQFAPTTLETGSWRAAA